MQLTEALLTEVVNHLYEPSKGLMVLQGLDIVLYSHIT